MKLRFLMAMVLASSPTPNLCGQTNIYGAWRIPAMSPRERRFVREQAVAYAGPHSRIFVESEIGDVAAFALLRCSQQGAVMLASFHASGGFGQLPRGSDLLMVIAHPQGGDPVCMYVVSHANELMHPDGCNAFLASPHVYVWGWKQLPVTSERSLAQHTPSPWVSGPSKIFGYERRFVVWAAGLVVLLLLFMWQRRRLARDLPA